MWSKESKYLKQSLIFQMSLGSKELFHSNVWAWLIEQDNRFIEVFFDEDDFYDYEIDKVEREKNHRDIIIWLKDKSIKKKTHYLVIENKIKSLPNEKQLEEYSCDIDKCKLKSAVITGIEDFLQNHKFNNITWNFVSYDTIANRIEECLSVSESEVIKSKKEQIKEYCEVVRSINSMIGNKLKDVSNELIINHKDIDYEEFNELRIDDILRKVNGAKFVKYLEDSLKDPIHELEDDLPDGYCLKISQSFNHNKVTIDIYYTNANDKWENDFFIIGIQTEGNQYRFVAARNPSKYNIKLDTFDKKEDMLFTEMSELNWFDRTYNCKEKDRKVFGHNSTMKSNSKYDSYKPLVHVYQHYTIENPDFEILCNGIIKDMKKAKDILNKFKK